MRCVPMQCTGPEDSLSRLRSDLDSLVDGLIGHDTIAEKSFCPALMVHLLNLTSLSKNSYFQFLLLLLFSFPQMFCVSEMRCVPMQCAGPEDDVSELSRLQSGLNSVVDGLIGLDVDIRHDFCPPHMVPASISLIPVDLFRSLGIYKHIKACDFKIIQN